MSAGVQPGTGSVPRHRVLPHGLLLTCLCDQLGVLGARQGHFQSVAGSSLPSWAVPVSEGTWDTGDTAPTLTPHHRAPCPACQGLQRDGKGQWGLFSQQCFLPLSVQPLPHGVISHSNPPGAFCSALLCPVLAEHGEEEFGVSLHPPAAFSIHLTPLWHGDGAESCTSPAERPGHGQHLPSGIATAPPVLPSGLHPTGWHWHHTAGTGQLLLPCWAQPLPAHTELP